MHSKVIIVLQLPDLYLNCIACIVLRKAKNLTNLIRSIFILLIQNIDEVKFVINCAQIENAAKVKNRGFRLLGSL